MADVADIVSAGADRREEFDRPHHRHVRAHRDGDGKRNQPYSAVRKEHRVGHQDAENRPRSTDGWRQRRERSEEHRNRLDDYLDEARAHST